MVRVKIITSTVYMLQRDINEWLDVCSKDQHNKYEIVDIKMFPDPRTVEMHALITYTIIPI